MSRTRVSQAIVFVGDEVDDIVLDVRDGHLTIGLGSAVAINLDQAPEAVLAKLAEVTTQALAVAKLRNTLAVA